jgi:hypothetical protein
MSKPPPPPPPPPPRRPADRSFPLAAGQANLLKIQTLAIVGIFVISLSAAGLYGFERYRETRRIQVLRAYSCGAARGELKSEAAKVWDYWQSYQADKIKGGSEFTMTAYARISAINKAVESLTSERLRAVESYCDPVDIETEVENVRSKYPGLTNW